MQFTEEQIGKTLNVFPNEKLYRDNVSFVNDEISLINYETAEVLSGSQTITKDSPENIIIQTSGSIKLTFTPAATTDACIKQIYLYASGTTTLTVSGCSWANGEDAPSWGTSGKTLILIANFINGKVILGTYSNDQK